MQHIDTKRQWILKDLYHFIGYMFLGVGLLVGVMYISGYVLIHFFGIDFETIQNTLGFTLFFFLLQTLLLFVLPLFLVFRKKHIEIKKAFSFNNVPLSQLTLYPIVGLIAGYFLNFILIMTMTSQGYFQIPGFSGEQENLITLFGDGSLSLFFAFLVIVIIGPIVEEIVFRGFVAQVFFKYFPPIRAGIYAGLFFGLLHFQLQILLPLFFFGCVLSFLYYKTQSIYPPIMLHILNNAVTFSIMMYVPALPS